MFGELDAMFYPEVYQAIAGKGNFVYAYMNDGSIHKMDINPFLKNGGVFEPLKDPDVFKRTLTVLNGTVAWDLEGNRDTYKCIDIDPEDIMYDSPKVEETDMVIQAANTAELP